jgi:hypothetical protein
MFTGSVFYIQFNNYTNTKFAAVFFSTTVFNQFISDNLCEVKNDYSTEDIRLTACNSGTTQRLQMLSYYHD